MAQTAATLMDVLKQAWTSDQLQSQIESSNNPLSRVESFKGTMIGSQAQVPLLTGRSYAYTSVGPAGGQLNDAQHQPIAKGHYTLVQSWFQIALETSALVQTGSNVQALVSAKDLEVQGAIENMRHQLARQVVTNGDSILAYCETGSGTTVGLTPAAAEGAAYGHAALQRGWIGSGAKVNIGDAANASSLASNVQVTGYNDSPTAPSITIPSSVNTTAGTHFVYVPNPNSATAPNPEINGLRQIVNTTGAFAGLDPATAGQEHWKAAARDTATTALSLDLCYALSRQVMQRTGQTFTDVWTSYKQRENYYKLLQGQVRFGGDSGLSAGNMDAVTYGGIKLEAFPDVLDTDWFCLTIKDLLKVTGSITKPTWASDVQGTKGQLWQQGTTRFVDGLVYPIQFGCQRRTSHAAATALQ